jgi:hypothetical protein
MLCIRAISAPLLMEEDHTTSILASILLGQNDLVSQTSYFQEGYFWFKLSPTKEIFVRARCALLQEEDRTTSILVFGHSGQMTLQKHIFTSMGVSSAPLRHRRSGTRLTM